MTAVASAGPGATGVLPPGVILTSAPLAFGARSGINIMGNGRMATVLRKTANIDLVQMNGSGPGAANHCSQCSLSHLTLDGNSSQYMTSGSSRSTSRSADCTNVTRVPKRAKNWPSSTPTGPPPTIMMLSGSSLTVVASRLVQ